MPIVEAEIATSTVQFVITLGGFGGLGGIGYVGFVKLKTRFDMFALHNDKSHKRICDAVEKLDDTGRKNTTDIATLKATCKGNHPA